MRLEQRGPVHVPGVERSGDSGNHRQDGPRRIPRGRRLTLGAVALVAVAAAAAWAIWANVKSDRPAMDMNMRVSSGTAAFPVTLVPVERSPIAAAVVYTGSVVPYTEEDVYPRVAGRIVDMPVYPGDAVSSGQIVARLDDVELGSRAQEAAAGAVAAAANAAQMEAEVVAARHGIVQSENEVAMAMAEVRAAREGITQMEKELAMAEAEAGYQEQVSAREERLFGIGAVARQDVENARAMVASARAKVAAVRAKVEQARSMATAAQAKADAARARLDQARAMETSANRRREAMAAMAAQGRAMQRTAEVVREYVNIRAQSTGYVVKRLVAPGVLVQPGMAILKIARIDRVRLQANVGEKDLRAIRVGSPVIATPAGAGQSAIHATVTSVFPFVDQGSRTAVVEALIDNAGRRVLPGQYVTMQFVTGERQTALTVPRTAVTRLGGQTRVWVVDGERTTPRDVTVGLESADRAEIVRGLTGTERVVARGQEGLYAGARVVHTAGDAAQPRASGAPPAEPAAGTPEPPTSPAPREKGGKHVGH